jgi:hypothetical protein
MEEMLPRVLPRDVPDYHERNHVARVAFNVVWIICHLKIMACGGRPAVSARLWPLRRARH